METNNLTPGENLKNRASANEKNESANTYDTVEAPGISFGDSIVHPEFIPDEDMADTGAFVIACLFGSIALLIVLAFLFYFFY